MGIKKHFIDIAGSAADAADPSLLRRTHLTIRKLTRLILVKEGGLVTTVGGEPRLEPGDADTAQVFRWTILEEIAAFLRDAANTGTPSRTVAKVVASDKALAAVPAERKALWEMLIHSGQIELQPTNYAWNAGAYLREHEARVGDALVVLGGGEGVEHLASLYVERGRPVIPLDAPVGAFSGDGRGGATTLFAEACSKPERFVLDPDHARSLPTALRRVSLREPDAEPSNVAEKLATLLDRVVVFRAFFIRLLNDQVPEYLDVDRFFSEVVTPCVRDFGYEEDQIGLRPASEALINREIFERLHYAGVVIADLTALRHNNFLELGYALARPLKTIITAKSGTQLPFDAQAMPVHFWKTDLPIDQRRRAFAEMWDKNIARPHLVRPRDLR